MSPSGPNLSHWPGNRTPAKWKADLSTGICLNFATAPAAEQAEFLAGATHVLNDHYDTDGFLSLLAVLRPEVALARREVILAAAGTGDFQSLQRPDASVDPRAFARGVATGSGDAGRAAVGFAIDRTVANLAAEGSPVAGAFAGSRHRDLDRYRWLLENAEEVLDHPERFAALHGDELARILAELEGPGWSVTHHGDLGLAVVRSDASLHRLTLNTIAGDHYRVLHAARGAEGWRFRYHDRTESWFEVATFRPRPRVDLAGLRDELQLAEGEPAEGGPRWCMDRRDEPVPELYFGQPSAQEYGQITRQLRASRLGPEAVEERFVARFAAAGN